MEVFSTRPRDFYLSDRDGLPSLHLDEKDATDLADMRSRNAYRNRSYDGDVLVRAGHDRFEYCRVRTRFQRYRDHGKRCRKTPARFYLGSMFEPITFRKRDCGLA